jgi:hypothetical protein
VGGDGDGVVEGAWARIFNLPDSFRNCLLGFAYCINVILCYLILAVPVR